jgi:hypothetical protein
VKIRRSYLSEVINLIKQIISNNAFKKFLYRQFYSYYKGIQYQVYVTEKLFITLVNLEFKK